MTPSTRRSFLGLLGTTTLAGFAGCSDSGTDEPSSVTIEIGGQVEQETTAELEVVSATAEDDLSENIVYHATFDIGPDGPEDAFREIEDAFESQRAIIRVLYGGVGVTGEYTFLPDCSENDTYDDVLHVTFRSPFIVTFRQNRCR